LLVNNGVVVVASDINDESCRLACDTLGIHTVSNDDLLTKACDVFAPCALGGVINQWSIPTLRAEIVAGAANNQLLGDQDHERLSKAGVLYCPDYLINAGGIVDVYNRRHGATQADIDSAVAAIALRLRTVLEEARARSVSPEQVAQERAENWLNTRRGLSAAFAAA
jgi:leucine dehydrogenase